ncbi:DNA polymerase III subunit delta [Martelella endophytica]|uniref:DNA polymerase III subunit delta n=1 Tax=Martelella endophytica TaxID=1486262 RepID=A0A0D5LMI8_MAREN|nr:DNA polymerase III subunit delta [Martelella endophytica]AJY45180.1 DNA polymerase III subunit delta [Martelella endophytica]
MTEIKSYQFDAFLRQDAGKYRAFLVYGPDRGLVSERASLIAKGTRVALDDPFSVMKLDIGDVDGDAGRIMDEMNAIGLFGGERLVWVRAGGNDKVLADVLKMLAETPPQSAFLIIEASELRKGTAMRKAAEGARSIAAIPCYADDTRALNGLVDEALGSANLRITPPARQLLLSLIGGDRLATRNEIEKLVLFARGLDVIDEEHVATVIGDASAISADDAVDAVLAGDIAALRHAMAKIAQSKTPIFLILNGCLRQFHMLDLMRADIEGKRQSVSQVMQSHGRGIFFKRKPLFEKALSAWNGDATARALRMLSDAVLKTRQYPALEESIAMQTLLALALRSNRGVMRG